MGTKAFLQKGRGKPGLVLPANAIAKVNQANDRSALVRAADKAKAMEEHAADPLPNIGTSITAKYAAPPTGNLGFGSYARLTVEPDPTPDGPGLKCEAPAPEPAPQAEEPPEPEQEPSLPSLPLEPADPPSLPLKVTADPNAPLTVVAGIGTALAERFATYGYKTLADLSKADPETINEIPGVRKRGRQWIDEARKRLGL